MGSAITEYRADFYLANGEVSFRMDSEPGHDPDATMPPIRLHAAVIRDNGIEVLRWVRPELLNHIDAIAIIDPEESEDCVCVFSLSSDGELLTPPFATGITSVEAFSVNNRGGVKQGCLFTVKPLFEHTVITIPSTTNYVLERLCYALDTHVQLFDNVEKRKGKRQRLNP